MSNAKRGQKDGDSKSFGILEIPAIQKYGTRGQTGKTWQGAVVLFPAVFDMSYIYDKIYDI